MNLTRSACFLCVYAILFISGLCLIFAWPLIFGCALSLKCNPVLFYLWKNVPVEPRTEFYFFNWTNPKDIYNASVKPKLEEVGPYVFLQKEEKCDIEWHNNGTLSYKSRKSWYYDKNVKNRDLEENVTGIDAAITGISYATRNWNLYVRRGVFLTLLPLFSKIFQTHPVRELLFEGYSEKILKISSAMPFFAHMKLPSWDRFGWMYSRNDSSEFEGVVNMGSGFKDLGRIYSWNHQNQTEYFENGCGKVSGYSGQFFGPNLKKDSVTIYSTDLRRPISLKFAFTKRVNNILGYTYTAGTNIFDNGTTNPKNWCFCTGECTPNGVANVSVTRHGSPLFVSLPHFYGADPSYLNMVEGLNPDPKNHEIFFTIEPVTGIVLEVDVKLQINMLLQPVNGVSMFQNVPKVYFPIFWSRQTAKIPGRETLILKVVLAANDLYEWVGVAFILVPIVLLLGQYFVRRNNPKLVSDIEEEVPLKDI